VLILGRFTVERKDVLDALREALRDRDYSPVLFDFDKPISKTTAETISTMAGLARFVIADLINAKSVLLELERIVPKNPSLPIQPLLLSTQEKPGMLDSLEPYPWFLDVYRYSNQIHLLESIEDVIKPADEMARLFRERHKAQKEAEAMRKEI
jgi:hypothetical protein